MKFGMNFMHSYLAPEIIYDASLGVAKILLNYSL